MSLNALEDRDLFNPWNPWIPFPVRLILFLIKLKGKIFDKTTNVIILGSKGSGKTTLWLQLQDKFTDKESVKNTDQEIIESFSINVDKKSVKVSSTKDFGGDDFWVEYYNEIINTDGTFIYFLVDLLRVEETKEEVRARLVKIVNVIREKGLKDCGCKILATNYAAYQTRGMLKSKGSPQEYVKKTLNINTSRLINLKLDSLIMAVELTDSADIEKIKKEIVGGR